MSISSVEITRLDRENWRDRRHCLAALRHGIKVETPSEVLPRIRPKRA